MNQSWQAAGRVAFWLSWPALWLYLRGSRRTRVLVSCGDSVLVVRTWLSDGAWALPGGGAHRRETALQAVRRELYEETGVALKEADFRSIGPYRFSSHGLSFHYDLFAAAVPTPGQLRLQPIEITDAQWLSVEQLAFQRLGPDVATALRLWHPRDDLLQ